MNGYCYIKMPKVNDRSNVYDHVYGCTYGFSHKKQTGEYGSIDITATQNTSSARTLPYTVCLICTEVAREQSMTPTS